VHLSRRPTFGQGERLPDVVLVELAVTFRFARPAEVHIVIQLFYVLVSSMRDI